MSFNGVTHRNVGEELLTRTETVTAMPPKPTSAEATTQKAGNWESTEQSSGRSTMGSFSGDSVGQNPPRQFSWYLLFIPSCSACLKVFSRQLELLESDILHFLLLLSTCGGGEA